MTIDKALHVNTFEMDEFLDHETDNWPELCSGQISQEDSGQRAKTTGGEMLRDSNTSDERKEEDFFLERVPPLSTPEPSLR